MRYLLDTHVLLWMRENNPKLSRQKWEPILLSPDNKVLVSIVSLWEITVKQSLGKLSLDGSMSQFAGDLESKYGFEILPLTPSDLDRLSRLPRHHDDPFDRLLIAQALEAGAMAVTNDCRWRKYRCKVQW